MKEYTWDNIMVDAATMNQVFNSEAFEAIMTSYFNFPGIADAIINDDTDWYTLREGARNYAFAIAMSIYSNKGLRQCYFTAFNITDKFYGYYTGGDDIRLDEFNEMLVSPARFVVESAQDYFYYWGMESHTDYYELVWNAYDMTKYYNPENL